MQETWIVALIAPAILTILGWLTNRMDKTAKLVGLLQGEIGRLDAKVRNLEARIEQKDKLLERKGLIIQEAFRCKTPSYRCPVLIKQSQFNDNEHEIKGVAQQQPGQHTPQSDEISGGGCGEG